MQQRERILLFGLVGVVGVWALLNGVESYILAPLSQKQAEIADLESNVSSKETEELLLFMQKGELRDWNAASLPPEPLNAQRVYQEWLVDLARRSGLKNVVPSARTPSVNGSIFTSIPVVLSASGTLEDVATFLHQFERTDLLHRITKADVVSTETAGNPQLNVVFAIDALSLPTAPERVRLLPRGELAKGLDVGTDSVQLRASDEFPSETPFRVLIDQEYLNVTSAKPVRNGDLVFTVERGVTSSAAARHNEGAVVELAPWREISDPGAPQSIADYRRMLEQGDGPFAKPDPPVVYNPKLASIDSPTIYRGESVNLAAKVSSWNPVDGKPVYALAEGAPVGMTISSTGEIKWQPAADVPAGKYPAEVLVTSPVNSDRKLTTAFAVTLRNRNLPPTLSVPEEFPIAYIGRVWKTSVSGNDPDATTPGASGGLTYALAGSPPEGLTIDSGTGAIRWEPPLTIEPGTKSITITATDRGDPPQSATATLSVEVADDAAEFTYLVGSLRDGANWKAWLYDRATERSQFLTIGSKFTISDIEGTVVDIDLKSIEFVDESGRWRLEHEQPLRKAAPLALTPGIGENAAAPTGNDPASAVGNDADAPRTDGRDETDVDNAPRDTDNTDPQDRERTREDSDADVATDGPAPGAGQNSTTPDTAADETPTNEGRE
ncbi:MAG: putative Ig domain-containing protein [Planctomycetaceae bacterium]